MTLPPTPFTRIVEMKHATGQQIDASTIIREFPKDWAPDSEPFYPVPTPESRAAYQRYAALAAAEQATSFIGRLATYRYFNMDQVTGMALAEAEKLIARYGSKHGSIISLTGSLCSDSLGHVHDFLHRST